MPTVVPTSSGRVRPSVRSCGICRRRPHHAGDPIAAGRAAGRARRAQAVLTRGRSAPGGPPGPRSPPGRPG
jgi:hypothetical protein